MQPLRLWLFLAFIAGLRAYELSKNLGEFYCTLNGDFNDNEQVETDGGNRSVVFLKFQPIVAPQLSSLPVIRLLETVDGALVRSLILIVSEGANGIVYTEPRNFTGNTSITTGTIDEETIKSLTPADLHGDPDCKDAFDRVKPLVFAINYPVCKGAQNNQEGPAYGATVSCDEFFGVVPGNAPEKRTLVPYHLKLQGNKYPLEGSPNSYACDCDNTSADGDN